MQTISRLAPVRLGRLINASIVNSPIGPQNQDIDTRSSPSTVDLVIGPERERKPLNRGRPAPFEGSLASRQNWGIVQIDVFLV